MPSFDLYNTFHRAKKLLFLRRVAKLLFINTPSFGLVVLSRRKQSINLAVLNALRRTLAKHPRVFILSLCFLFPQEENVFLHAQFCPPSLLWNNESACLGFELFSQFVYFPHLFISLLYVHGEPWVEGSFWFVSGINGFFLQTELNIKWSAKGEQLFYIVINTNCNLWVVLLGKKIKPENTDQQGTAGIH